MSFSWWGVTMVGPGKPVRWVVAAALGLSTFPLMGTAGCDLDQDGYPASGGDCDDLDHDVYPGAPEACDLVDEDCDEEVDESVDCSGLIATLAGTGNASYNGDEIPAHDAWLDSPAGVTLLSSGDLLISDWYNSRVRRVDTDRIIHTFAGSDVTGDYADGVPATVAQLNGLLTTAEGVRGEVYIADTFNYSVKVVEPSGFIYHFAGGGGATGDNVPALDAFLYLPYDVAVDSRGNVYIADLGANRVYRVDTKGYLSNFAGNGSENYSGDGGFARSAGVPQPRSLAIDVADNVYISDGSCRIRRVDTNSKISTVAGNGICGEGVDKVLATSTSLNMPYGIDTSPRGELYIADQVNQKIRRVGLDQIIETIAGSGELGDCCEGKSAVEAELNFPQGVCVSGAGDVYIADTLNNRVRQVFP